MALLVIILIVLAVWWYSKQYYSTKNDSVNTTIVEHHEVEEVQSSESNKITEETVFKRQMGFETILVEEINFPDAMGGREIYIYRNLILPWYNELSSKSRYDDAMIQNLRSDFLEYIWALEDRKSKSYLSIEFENEETRGRNYKDASILANKKARAIEDAFAASIGQKAVEELARIRKLSLRVFNDRGEIAPDGFMFASDDELISIK